MYCIYLHKHFIVGLLCDSVVLNPIQISSGVAAHIKEILQHDHKADLVEVRISCGLGGYGKLMIYAQVIDPLMQYLVKNMSTFHGSLLVPVLEV